MRTCHVRNYLLSSVVIHRISCILLTVLMLLITGNLMVANAQDKAELRIVLRVTIDHEDIKKFLDSCFPLKIFSSIGSAFMIILLFLIQENVWEACYMSRLL